MRKRYRHVSSTAGIPRARLGVDETARDAEVTQLDGAVPVQQHIRRFHV